MAITMRSWQHIIHFVIYIPVCAVIAWICTVI